jgi:transcriptional regulator with XRE-family HTH domain
MMEETDFPQPPKARESSDAVLAKNLIVARGIRGVTQQDLSAKSGISRATIAQLESGYSDPRLSTIALLADALNVPLIFLLVGITDAQILAELPGRIQSAPLQISTQDLRRMQHLVATGLLKDRLRAARLGAAVAQRVAEASASVCVSAAIFSGILPGTGTVVGHALDQLLDELKT